MKKKSVFPYLCLLLFCLVLSGCGEKKEESVIEPPAAIGEHTGTPAPAVTETPVFTVSYTVNGVSAGSESVRLGESPVGIAVEGAFRCWLDENGETVRLNTLSVESDRVFTAAFMPRLREAQGAMEPNKDGLFHPNDPFTRSDAVRLVYRLLADKPAKEVFLKDVTTSAQCYKAASTLAAAGYVELNEGKFDPDVPITLGDLSALLEKVFPAEKVDAAMSHCQLPLSRGGAAALFAELLGVGSGGADYPDVSPEHPYYAAVSALGAAEVKDWGERRGFTHINGRLYCFDERGYFLRDADVGTLHFGSDCAFTFGDETLDALISELMRNKIQPGRDQEANLRKAYLHVRDSYLYLRRNFYEVGETGWEIAEATTMLQSEKGNCYNFTAVFWALSRALGYDAVCVSGLVGRNADPHSWVEIPFPDGVTYIFDPETEMSYRLKDVQYNCFKMTYEEGEYWTYFRG